MSTPSRSLPSVSLAARSLARALYLGKLRHIGIAQDKTDVWMRDKTTISVYHKGTAMTREFVIQSEDTSEDTVSG